MFVYILCAFLNKNKTKYVYPIVTHVHYKWESSIHVMKTSQRPVHTYNDNDKCTAKLLYFFLYVHDAFMSPAAW